MKRISRVLRLSAMSTVLALAACGGGSSTGTQSPFNGTSVSGASAGAVSSGSVTAFGSIFVNGHEFSTTSASIVDDDAGTTSSDTSSLEVGMSVDVKAAADSSSQHPVASEVHLHPLVRGVVDGSDSAAGTLTVMGQTVQLTASTNFSDHRACLTAVVSPCTAVTGQSGLLATTGAGASALAGNYVTVHGFLYAADATSGNANVVATLVSVADAPSSPFTVAYKAEGVVTALSGSTLTIGGLAVDLSAATCYAAGVRAPCASAFSAGQIVSAFGSAAPALPATAFAAGIAMQRNKLAVETAGATVELEGQVSQVSTSPASFVVHGVTVDASSLAGSSLPAFGDQVRVLGTVASGGTSLTASAVTVLHAARAATFGFEGDIGSVAAGSCANTYVLSLLGQTISVDASARLADRSVNGSGGPSSASPFNIATFQSYLAASPSQHLLVRTQADAGGHLSALSLTIVPPSTAAGVGGVVDATPAPVNGASSGSLTTFSVHGLPVSADAAAVFKAAHDNDSHGFGGMRATSVAAVAAGDLVLVRGSFVSGTLTVEAPSGPFQPFDNFDIDNAVIDYGMPDGHDHDDF
jgi:hypothetical protein